MSTLLDILAADLREKLGRQVNVFDGFGDLQDMMTSYDVDPKIAKDMKENAIIIEATYNCECYEGWSSVFYYHTGDRNFYEVHGSHCSCYGLEDQWTPELIGDIEFFKEYMEKRSN